MYIYNKKLSRERKFTLAREAGMLLALLFFGLSLTQISGTNSFFTDSAEIKGIEFRAGNWIPTLEMEVSPEEPDGEDGWYTESPCVKFNSDMDDVTIYYSFVGEDETINGEIDEDTCVYPPEGESELSAWAVNEENDDWMSTTITQTFKVGQQVKEGDVVINELMWMGSFKDSKDEWIELRNMTDREIDLSGWEIKYAGKGKNGHIEIPNGYSIEANGYFLLTAKKWDETAINLSKDLDKDDGYTHVAGMDLNDEGEKLILKNKNKDSIDEVWQDKRWPDGWHGFFLHMSMERNSEVGSGKNDSDWHTCVDKKCNDKEYWRKEGFNFGTPGKKNSTRDDSFEHGCDRFEERLIEKNSSDNDDIGDVWKKNFKKRNHTDDEESEHHGDNDRCKGEDWNEGEGRADNDEHNRDYREDNERETYKRDNEDDRDRGNDESVEDAEDVENDEIVLDVVSEGK